MNKGNRVKGLIDHLVKSISIAFVSLIVIMAILLVGTRLIGLTPYTVISGSMEPKFAVGSLIYVRSVETEKIQIGDPITFVMNKDLRVATHRVVEITPEGNFVTKGDANETIDGTSVHPNNVIGKPEFSIPYLGYLSVFLSSIQGRIVLGILGILILISMLVPEKDKKMQVAD